MNAKELLNYVFACAISDREALLHACRECPEDDPMRVEAMADIEKFRKLRKRLLPKRSPVSMREWLEKNKDSFSIVNVLSDEGKAILEKVARPLPSQAENTNGFKSFEAEYHAALRKLLKNGQSRISANCLAAQLWPDARHCNNNGQSFNLAAGVAGRILRKYRGCHEVTPRLWEIVPELIS